MRLWLIALLLGLTSLPASPPPPPANVPRGVVDALDHSRTGFPLDGRHQEVACEGCHRNSVFAGTPRRCADCHNNVAAEGKTFLHIPVTAACDSCHNTKDWLTNRLDHTGIYVRCSTCHNNLLAPGKTVRHPPTSNTCEMCHITVHWNQLLPGARGELRLPGSAQPGGAPS